MLGNFAGTLSQGKNKELRQICQLYTTSHFTGKGLGQGQMQPKIKYRTVLTA